MPFKERASRSDEALELMRALWTQEHPKIQTKRHRVQDVVASPMPLQKPRPPLYIGGASEGAYRRVARLGDGWHASSMNHDAFRQGGDTVRRFWKDAGRDGAPFLSLRIPILIDGVHRPAVDMALLRGRHTLNGSAKQIADELSGFKALGCGHVALEVSYSTFPAIFETIDLVAEKIRPHVAD